MKVVGISRCRGNASGELASGRRVVCRLCQTSHEGAQAVIGRQQTIEEMIPLQRIYRYAVHNGRRYEIHNRFLSLVEELSEDVLQSGRVDVDQETFKRAFTYQLSDTPENIAAMEWVEYGEAKPWSMAFDEQDRSTTCGLKIKGKSVFLSEIAWILEDDTVRDFIGRQMPELTPEEIEAALRVMTGLVSGLECDVRPAPQNSSKVHPPAYPIHAVQLHELAQIDSVVRRTISDIYPHYYPSGAVAYFQSHHSADRIAADIGEGCVFAAAYNGETVGTVTVKDNEILRLFVLPSCQGKGIGSALLDFAEHRIVRHYSAVSLAASLPAQDFYRKCGYCETAFHQIPTKNGDRLCYCTMTKQVFRTIPWWEL